MHDYWTLMKKLIWLRILQGASFVVNKITGTSPITLTNAINSAIISLKQYGKCVQDGTPTPSSPVDIKCNNGKLGIISEGVPIEYIRIEYLQSSGAQYIDTGITINYATQRIEQRATVQYTTSNTNRELMGANGYGFWGKSAEDKLESATGSTVPITESALVKNTVSLITDPNNNNQVTFIVNSNRYDSSASTLADNNYACYVFALGGRSGAAASFFCHAKVYEYAIILDNVMVSHLIPVKRRSDGVLGMYDTVTNSFKVNAGTGTFTAGSAIGSVGVIGTPETLMVSGANLLDPSAVIEDNQYINSRNGGTTSPSAVGGVFRYSGFIPVKEGTKYFFGCTPFSASSAGLAWYSTDDVPVTGFIDGMNGTTLRNSTNNMKVTAPEGAQYLRFCWRIDEDYDTDWQHSVYVCECINNEPVMSAWQPYVGPQTASVENLFAVDNIVDEQDIITGKVIRRTEAVVSDGTTPSGRYVGEVGVGNIIVKARETGYTGEVVSFTTEEETPLNGLRVNFEPIQDLHGYDAPWPAGGGVNKLLPSDIDTSNTTQSVTATWVAETEELTLDGTNSGSYNIVIVFRAVNGHIKFPELQVGDTWSLAANLPTGSYIGIVYKNTSNTDVQFWYLSGDGTFKKDTRAVPNDFVSFQRVQIGINPNAVFSNAKCHLAFVSGSTITAWSPYENICPIYGHTDADVWDDPKYGGLIEWNQLAPNNFESDTAGMNIALTAGMPIVAGHRYLSVYKRDGNQSRTRIGVYTKKGTGVAHEIGVIIDVPQGGATSGASFISFTETVTSTGGIGDDGAWLYRNGFTPADKVTLWQLFDLTQMFGAGNEPSTVEEFEALFPKDYYAYNSGTLTTVSAVNGDTYRHYPIPLGQTVYGGTLNVLTGVLTVTHKYKEPPKADVRKNASYQWYIVVDSEIACGAELPCISNMFRPWNGTESLYKHEYMCFQNSGGSIRFNSPVDYATVDDLWDVVGGMYFICQLATPQTIQLTSQQVELLLGENNIWSNAKSVNVYVSDGELIVQVTPQKLKTAEGTNVVEVTSNVDPVTLEVEYKENR